MISQLKIFAQILSIKVLNYDIRISIFEIPTHCLSSYHGQILFWHSERCQTLGFQYQNSHLMHNFEYQVFGISIFGLLLLFKL